MESEEESKHSQQSPEDEIEEEEFSQDDEQGVDAEEIETKTEKGICYFPRVPPYMTPLALRKLLAQRFKLGRIFLQAEAESTRKQRKKSGGNHKLRYTEGWVEFLDKREAKLAAVALNSTQIGGKKRHNLFYDDTWTLRYLPKFKWHNLTEKLAYDQRVREQRLKAETNQAKKEMTFYMEKVDLKKRLDKMEEKKLKKAEKAEHIEESDDDGSADEGEDRGKVKKVKNMMKMMKYHQRKRREFKQREPLSGK